MIGSNRWSLLLPVAVSLSACPAGAQVEELVVTAHRRPQAARSIGGAVMALNGDALARRRVRQPADLDELVPNLDIKNTLGTSNPVLTIRGVGLNDFAANNEQSAGVYVDEVFMSSPAMMGFQLHDIERAEVLLGPQGTLYGRNTTAGAVNFVTRRPSPDFLSRVALDYGNFGRVHGEAVLNGAVSEGVSARLSTAGDWSDEGYFHNRLSGRDHGALRRLSARLQVLWRDGRDRELLLNVHGGADHSEAATIWTAVGLLDPAGGGLCAPARDGDLDGTVARCADLGGYQDRDGDPFAGAWNLEPRGDIRQFGASLTGRRRLGALALTSISAYEGFDRYLQEEADGGPHTGLHIEYDDSIHQISQELRLASAAPTALAALPGEVNWMAGLFVHADERRGSPAQRLDVSDWFNDALYVRWKQTTRSAALFSHNEWRLNERWQAVVGGRYTWEEREFDSQSGNLLPHGGVSRLTGTDFLVSNGRVNRIDNGEFTGTISLEYTPLDQMLAWLKLSKGFKSGGFSGLPATSQEELDPYGEEELLAWEAGVKTTLLQGALHADVSLFRYDYDGMQVFAIPLDAAVPVPRLSNAEEARVHGVDASLAWRPRDGLDLSAGLGWLDTRNDDPRFAGLDLPNAPGFTFSGSVRYERPLGDGLRVESLLGLSYTGAAFKTVENKPLLRARGYHLLSARLTLRAGERWEAALWANNLSDARYIDEAYDQSGLGYLIYNYGEPRTYGVSLSMNWR